jgi:hypothetical protein
MGVILGAKCSCGFLCKELPEGFGERYGSSKLVCAIYSCSDCKNLFSQLMPKLPERPKFETTEPLDENKKRIDLWQAERTKIVQLPIACPDCGKTSGKIVSLFEYQPSEKPFMRKYTRFKARLRKSILNAAHSLPRWLSSRIYWATIFLSAPYYITTCPKCNNQRLRLYSVGNWD